MRIGICDDDKQEREELLRVLHEWDPTRNAELFIEGSSLLKAAKKDPHFSIVFWIFICR